MSTGGWPTQVAEVDGAAVEYRFIPGGERIVILLPGAHMPAACRFGEDVFVRAGCSVLVVSRPGYGRTAVDAGPGLPAFVDRVAALAARLGARPGRLVAAGISMGARSALTLAARRPDLVERVVLVSPVSFRPWPPRRTLASRVLFSLATEWATWGLAHTLLRNRPDVILPRAIGGLSTLPATVALRRTGAQLDDLVDFLATCRSGRGYTLDLRPVDQPPPARQPSLILATRNDAAVSFEHPQHLADTLPAARLVELDAPSHLLWLGDARGATRRALLEFLRG